MSIAAALDEVEILIPKAILDRRKATIAETRLDFAALIDALPSASPSSDELSGSPLNDVDLADARAWITRVIRALSTQADMEATYGNV